VVAGVTKARQWAAASLEVTRTHVVEHQGPVVQVLARQCVLDRSLRHPEPVERRVDFVDVDVAQSKRHPERIDGGFLVECTGRGKLCGRIDQPLHNHRQSEVALTSRPIGQKFIKLDLARHAQHRRDMSVWQRASHLEAFRGSQRVTTHPQCFDPFGRQIGEIRQRAVFHAVTVTVTLPQEDGGARASVRDDRDVHGNLESAPLREVKAPSKVFYDYNLRL
jgi:hypothetical protein